MKINIDTGNNDGCIVIYIGTEYDEFKINSFNNNGTIIIQKNKNGKTEVEKFVGD